MTAPDELAGQHVACPRCQKKFPIEEHHADTRKTLSPANPSDWMLPPSRSGAAKGEVSTAETALSPPGFPPAPSAEPPAGMPPAVPVPPVAQPGPPAASPSPASLPPPTAKNPPRANPAGPVPPHLAPPVSGLPMHGPAGGPSMGSPTGQPAAPANAAPGGAAQARFQGAPPAGQAAVFRGDEALTKPLLETPAGPSTGPLPGKHSGQPAFKGNPLQHKVVQRPKVIINDAAATNVALGADGKLPELQLQKVSSNDEEPAAPSPKSPLLVICVLVLSFAASIGMLFMPDDFELSESGSKQKSRDLIVKYYIQPLPGGELAEYQKRLRLAIQAHSLGNDAQERRYYHQVLDMLHSENQSETRGMTGLRSASTHPNDEGLQKLLSTLLSR
ncbi:hypothetical protein [Lignipirellula cremea]|uniref:hypothetical protein n=1 Tax=Lignipirellula cremea TaxID=2528010 RepID=UPI0011A70186|nr:hypothetical protein [Lignipirellula cremea]